MPIRCLQQFARLPRVGTVKTRLHSALSPQEACEVHRELMLMTSHTLLAARLGPVELWLDELGDDVTVQAALAAGMRGPKLQQGRDLGARMHGALKAALRTSAKPGQAEPGKAAPDYASSGGLAAAREVLLVGSDCPGLSAAYLHDAFAQLALADVVLGPAEDGGFVLIGLRAADIRLFTGVPWGSDKVLARTLDNISALGLSVALLPEQYDVDTPADLQRWRREAP